MAELSWDGETYSSTKLKINGEIVPLNPCFMPSDVWEALYRAKSLAITSALAAKLISMAGPREEPAPPGLNYFDEYAEWDEEE